MCAPKSLIASALVCVAFSSAGALAENQHVFLKNNHFIYAGAFDQKSDTLLMAQREGFEPVKIQFENLGLSDKYTSWMLEYHYRLSDNWRLSASAYRFTQGQNATVTESFNYDGQQFDVGLNIKSKISIDTYIFDAMYTVYGSDNAEINIGGGIHALDNSLSIAARGSINGEEGDLRETASASVLAPLPNLRASGFYAFNEDWALWATVGWLSVNIDNIEGSFEYAHVRGQYQMTDNLGLSLGYQIVGVDVQENKDNGVNLFDMEFTGVTAALSYSF